MDFGFTEQETMIRDSVRRYAEAELLPHYKRWDRTGEFLDRPFIDKLVATGLLNLRLPEKFGGQGASFVECGIVCEEIGRCDHQIRYIVSNAIHIGEMAGSLHPELQEEWIPRIAKGEMMSLAFTEPGGGADAGNIRSKATKDGDYWIINGEKTSITFSDVSKVVFMTARTGGPGPRGLSFFCIPTDTPGVKVKAFERMGQRLDRGGSMFFDDVRIPDANRLPEVQSLKGPLSCLNEARYGIVWGVVGAARSCFEAALDYAMTRKQFDEPIASFQLTQAKLADMATKVQQGYLLALRLGQLKDEGRIEPEHISMGKRANARMALDVARTARGILGANGITLEYPVLRHANNLESVFTYEGTDEIHTLSIGMALTGIPAFR